MLKKPLSVVISDQRIEEAIIDQVVVNAVNAAIGVKVGKTIKIWVNRYEYSYYVNWTGGDPTEAADLFIRNLSDEVKLHGLEFEWLSHPNDVDIHAHFEVQGELS